MLGIDAHSNRNFGLDLLRALAIFFVVHGHGAFLLADTHLVFTTRIPMPDVVDIFFVLTGFLIGGIFLSYAEKQHRVDNQKVLRFYARTALRILPNYYVVLIVYILLVKGGLVVGNTSAFPLWRFATFTQNLCTPFYDFYWESWCLPVQWWFYILFPLLLLLFSKQFSVKKITPIICLFFIMLSVCYRIAIASYATDEFWWDVWVRKTVLSRFDCIYFGVLAAWVRHYFPEMWDRHAVKSFLLALVLLTIVILLPRQIGTLYKNVFYFTLQAISIVMFLPFVTRIQSYRTVFGKLITKISVLSYAMYLVNLMIVQLISNNFSDSFHHWGVWGYLLYWFIVLMASYLLYILVERPFAKIRARIK